MAGYHVTKKEKKKEITGEIISISFFPYARFLLISTKLKLNDCNNNFL